MKFVFLVGVVLLASVLVALPGPEPQAPVSELTISLPPLATAGTAVEAVVDSDTGAVVRVVFTSSYRTAVHEIELTSPKARIPVPFTSQSGTVSAVAVAGDHTAQAVVHIEPGPVAGIPDPLLGARSIVADGFDRAMVVAIATDQFGNPVPEPSTIDVVHPDGSGVSLSSLPTNTLRWAWVTSATRAGTAVVSVVTPAGRGVGRTLLEVPDIPVTFGLVLDAQYLVADGVSLLTVSSDRLADRHGNLLLDGTAASVRAVYPDGSVSVQTTLTIDGVASAILRAPVDPGALIVEMTVQGVAGVPLVANFAPSPVSLAGTVTPPIEAVAVTPTGATP